MRMLVFDVRRRKFPDCVRYYRRYLTELEEEEEEGMEEEKM